MKLMKQRSKEKKLQGKLAARKLKGLQLKRKKERLELENEIKSMALMDAMRPDGIGGDSA